MIVRRLCRVFSLSPVLVDEESHDDHDKGDETPLQDRSTAPRVIVVIILFRSESTGRNRDGVVEPSSDSVKNCLETVVILGQGACVARKEVSSIMGTSEKDVSDARDVERGEKVFSTPSSCSFVDRLFIFVSIKVTTRADLPATHLGLEEVSEAVVLVAIVRIR